MKLIIINQVYNESINPNIFPTIPVQQFNVNNVPGYVNITYPSYQITPPIIREPFFDALSLYTKDPNDTYKKVAEKIYVSNYQIEACFMSNIEFMEWLDRLIHRTVFMRKTSDIYEIVFLYKEDAETFQTGLKQLEPHKVEIVFKNDSLVEEFKNEYKLWKIDNIHDRNSLQINFRNVIGYFKDLQDAMLFKIKWSDYENNENK